MLDYQSFICKKCGKAVLRTMDTKYCQYCGAKLPELKEMPKVCCPMCLGTGKVDALAVQPFGPVPGFFNEMTNKTKDSALLAKQKRMELALKKIVSMEQRICIDPLGEIIDDILAIAKQGLNQPVI